jgi:hypothetical protein
MHQNIFVTATGEPLEKGGFDHFLLTVVCTAVRAQRGAPYSQVVAYLQAPRKADEHYA